MTSVLTTDGLSTSIQPGAQIQRIAALACDLNSSPKDWVSVLKCIPELSVRILQVVNASYGCLPGHIATINQAIVLLGFNTVKNLASRLAVGVSSDFRHDAELAG